MKKGVYGLLKAKFLIEDDALKNWKFIFFLVFLAIIMIATGHRFDEKNYLISELSNKRKELRSSFVDNRSILMKLKMESTVISKMEQRGIYSSEVPPVKIVVEERVQKAQKKWWEIF
jgi:hypothetical protein